MGKGKFIYLLAIIVIIVGGFSYYTYNEHVKEEKHLEMVKKDEAQKKLDIKNQIKYLDSQLDLFNKETDEGKQFKIMNAIRISQESVSKDADRKVVNKINEVESAMNSKFIERYKAVVDNNSLNEEDVKNIGVTESNDANVKQAGIDLLNSYIDSLNNEKQLIKLEQSIEVDGKEQIKDREVLQVISSIDKLITMYNQQKVKLG